MNVNRIKPAYYNEIEPFAVEWLKNLIAAGQIAPGDVDSRSIVDVKPEELKGYRQCHFFAGVGVWSYSLRRASVPDDYPVWTGSCPCQPFSAAGKGVGVDDERHLWPPWFHLIRESRPKLIFGEQVEAAINHGWLDLIQSDLEGEGYSLGYAGVPACGVGAPHIRQRLWFVADSSGSRTGDGLRHIEQRTVRWDVSPDDCSAYRLADADDDKQRQGRGPGSKNSQRDETRTEPSGRCSSSELGNSFSQRLEGLTGDGHGEAGWRQQAGSASEAGKLGSLADPTDRYLQKPFWRPKVGDGASTTVPERERPGPTNGHWGAADWIFCRDGKWRPIEPGLEPLAHGTSARVGRLRAYGNAIAAPVAQAFIEAYIETKVGRPDRLTVEELIG